MRGHTLLAGLFLMVIALPGRAIDKKTDPLSPDGLAKSLRGFVLKGLPPVLYEDKKNWGNQKLVTRGVEWKGAGNPFPQKQKSHKNHGVWRHVVVTPVNPALNLDLQIHDVVQTTPDTRTFTTFLALDLRVEAEQQNWRAGIKTFSGSFRGRLRVLLTLQCEVSTKLVPTGGLIPDLVFRIRVLKSDVRYDRFVTEHVAGVGGDMAEWLGDKGHRLLKKIKPSLEKNMLEKANIAIVRAADTKEVRVGFGKLFSK